MRIDNSDCSPANKEMLTGNGDPGSIGLMKTTTTGLILALCFFGAALCFGDNPQMDTSKVNESKSKLTPGRRRLGRRISVWCNSPIRASKPPSRRPSGWPHGPPGCSRWELLSSRCIGHSVSMIRCASSRPRTMRQPPVCCWQRTCWATFAPRRCVLSRPPRWKRSWPRYHRRRHD